MRTYVLVHGANGGGWIWREFAPLLRQHGHEVYTPTLTGQGERVHLGGPDTNLSTHIQDIVNVIEYEDLHDIVLVGASYSGIVVTGAADRVPERIAHVVYLDAVLPVNGQSVYDWGVRPRAVLPDGWRLQMEPLAPDANEDEKRRYARRTPQPRGCVEEKLRLSAPIESHSFSRTYVRATGWAPPPFERTAARVRNNPSWRYIEWPCGHDIHTFMPNELAQLLLEMA